MASGRYVHVTVSIGFLAVICAPALVQIILETRQGETPQALGVFAQKPTVENLRAYETGLEEASWVTKQLRPWMQYAQYVLLHNAGEKGVIGLTGWLFYRPSVEYLTLRSDTALAAGRNDDPLPAILSFRNHLAARGIALLVIPAPNKASVYPEKLTSRMQQWPAILSTETRALMERLEDAGVDVVDLFEAFHKAKQTANHSLSNALYLSQDTHWSPTGVELAAQTVARTILEHGGVARGNVEYAVRPVSLYRVGDLVQMMHVPAIERRVEPETIRCVQVVRGNNGAPYRDDPDSEILVIGDSFLRVYEKDEPGAAGFIAHLARELKRPLASLVSDGGASTLVRQELYRRPQLLAGKRVVVWEFVERDIRFGAEGWQVVPLPPASPR